MPATGQKMADRRQRKNPDIQTASIIPMPAVFDISREEKEPEGDKRRGSVYNNPENRFVPFRIPGVQAG